MMRKANVFVFFELNEIKSKSMTLPPSDSTSTIRQHPSKAPREKRPNALIPIQKIENVMTRTFLKILTKKLSLVRHRGVYKL